MLDSINPMQLMLLLNHIVAQKSIIIMYATVVMDTIT